MTSPYDQTFYQAHQTNSARSAALTVPVVLKHIQPKTIIDVGCGIGTWTSEFQRNGIEAYGVDGDYVDRDQLLISPERFTASDLSRKIQLPEEWPKKYDLAMSLEVAEHLPETSADMFVGSLTSLSDIVLFAAAIPYQGGTHHINEQWQSYWAAKFHGLGYTPVDVIRPHIWNNADVAYVYSQNTILYVNNRILDDYPGLKRYSVAVDHSMLSVVHPLKWDKTVNPARQSIRIQIKAIVRTILRRHLKKR